MFTSHKVVFTLLILALAFNSFAQEVDSVAQSMNMDAVYKRPFLTGAKSPVALGGYIEANSNYSVTDGVNEGVSFHMQRLTIFMSSTIKQRIKFLTEIEFEDGTKEINIEFAALDFEINPLFIVRGGIIMNPIGAYNQNHDGPKWEFIDRPLRATSIVPSTWSNVGFGVYGKKYAGKWVWAYEAYLTNGFDDKIIDNDLGRTSLPASKENPDRFEESFNGIPMTTLKTAVKNRKIGEIGLSWMGDVYNTFQVDGVSVDSKRRVDVFAIDFNTQSIKNTYITGEWSWALIDVPASYSQQYGTNQTGGFLDVVYTFLRGRMIGWDNSTLNLALRTEYVDYNAGTFNETGGKIYDEVVGIIGGFSFRPSSQSVIRANYAYHWSNDILGNSPSKTAKIQFGFSSYF